MRDTRSIRRYAVLAVTPLFLLACSTSAKDDVELSAQPSSGGVLQVDDVCSPACAGDEKVDVRVTYKSTGAVQQGNIELVQYRIDYAIAGLADVPFYGGRINNLTIAPGDEKTLNLVVVGAVQRDFVRQAKGSDRVTGTGKLTLAGYDQENRQVFLDTTFPLVFGAIADAGGSNGSQ